MGMKYIKILLNLMKSSDKLNKYEQNKLDFFILLRH